MGWERGDWFYPWKLKTGRGRVDLTLEEGVVEGAAVWRRIMAAVQEVQRERWADDAIN
jgi:hypothetical protein